MSLLQRFYDVIQGHVNVITTEILRRPSRARLMSLLQRFYDVLQGQVNVITTEILRRPSSLGKCHYYRDSTTPSRAG